MIPYGRQSISEADVAAVVAALKSDFLTQGPAVPRFEAAMAAWSGARHATAMSSATSVLHAACVALGLKPGGRLWTSPNTFVASANCARYCGADVDFVDIDPATGNLCPQRLEDKLQQAKKRKRKALPDIVVPVHFAGLPCDMPAIAGLARRYGFKVIEDASHAVGASDVGGRCGNGVYSDVTVFSFHPVKIVTTGEGGMALTRNPKLHAQLQLLRTHGITRDARALRGRSDGGWYYQQVALGWNYRMTDLQAALGASQLERLDAFLARRRVLVERYHAALADLPLVRPVEPAGRRSSWHLYVVRVKKRRQVYDAMRAAGIGVNVHYIPVHRQPYYRALGFKAGAFPEAERHYAEALSLPLFPDLTGADQDRVIQALRRALA